ncbi:MAG TPA: type III secretion system chaperone [Fimbriimonadaceae bacterium]|nr:type III secretion system chaperone [Fimbriimonadaceae bacterium]
MSRSAKSIPVLAVVLFGAVVLPVAIGAPQLAPNPSGPLTNDGLKTVLDNLGLEPQRLNGGYMITISRDGWSDAIVLGLSEDNSKLGLNANLGQIAKPETVTAGQWRKLLEDNFEINPSFISFDAKEKRLFMARVLDNRSITPAFLRKQIDNFCTNIHGTAVDWQGLTTE